MGEIVNLRQWRKQAERTAKDKAAEASRAEHGRTKAEKNLTKARKSKEERDLDGHKRDE